MKKFVLILFFLVVIVLAGAPAARAQSTAVSFDPAGGIELCAQTEIIELKITDAVDLYAYEIEVSYDPGKASAVGAFDNSWFNTAANALIVPGWDAQCGAGTCRFAVTKSDPGASLSGSGPVATIAVQRTAAGTFDLTVESVLLTDEDGFVLPAALPSAPLELTGCGEVITDPGDELELCDDPQTVDINIDGMSDLYAYEIEVSYDANKAMAVGAFDDSWFDTSSDALLVPGWEAVCDAGICRFAVSKSYTAAPLSGGGTVATITLDREAAGDFDVTIEHVVLTDMDGFTITAFLPDLPLSVTGCGEVVLDPGDELLVCGDPETVYLDINLTDDLYGYQIQVSYNSSLVNADATFVNSWFDTSPGTALIVPDWDADCDADICQFAVAKEQPQPPLSGSGTVAEIELTPIGVGSFDMVITTVVLTDMDGFVIPAYTAVTPLTVTAADDCGYADFFGYVEMQGRLTPIDEGTVTFVDEGAVFPDTVVPFSALDGSYSATVPVLLSGSTYHYKAAHLLYLTNKHDPVLLFPGDFEYPATTQLRGGDANNDGKVNILDVGCMGAVYLIGGDCGGQGSTDINADGYTDINDVGIAATNYLLINYRPW